MDKAEALKVLMADDSPVRDLVDALKQQNAILAELVVKTQAQHNQVLDRAFERFERIATTALDHRLATTSQASPAVLEYAAKLQAMRAQARREEVTTTSPERDDEVIRALDDEDFRERNVSVVPPSSAGYQPPLKR